MGLIPGLGRSSRIGNGTPLQYSCLENSMGRGAWQATVHGATKIWTQLSPDLQGWFFFFLRAKKVVYNEKSLCSQGLFNID